MHNRDVINLKYRLADRKKSLQSAPDVLRKRNPKNADIAIADFCNAIHSDLKVIAEKLGVKISDAKSEKDLLNSISVLEGAIDKSKAKKKSAKNSRVKKQEENPEKDEDEEEQGE